MKTLFVGTGHDLVRGPTPLRCSARGWCDRYARLPAPRGRTLWDAIDHIRAEIRWSGEALLAYRSIALDAREPLLRAYHCEPRYVAVQRLGETSQTLAQQQWFAAVYPSTWEFEFDAAVARSTASRIGRHLKRWRRRLGAMR